ncbi:hypothetical protein EYF80_021504 [Liparis tanakae]|uniref:Uncharacterized protein n=1 Tax=Liparis tanakae TaxID=230148 RepID=A0A4Z2HRZ8_9TELE|nr:hypothetical protein EYF80_021504 [Liparis tanakae]
MRSSSPTEEQLTYGGAPRAHGIPSPHNTVPSIRQPKPWITKPDRCLGFTLNEINPCETCVTAILCPAAQPAHGGGLTDSAHGRINTPLCANGSGVKAPLNRARRYDLLIRCLSDKHGANMNMNPGLSSLE